VSFPRVPSGIPSGIPSGEGNAGIFPRVPSGTYRYPSTRGKPASGEAVQSASRGGNSPVKAESPLSRWDGLSGQSPMATSKGSSCLLYTGSRG
jgi:hypothetical protein